MPPCSLSRWERVRVRGFSPGATGPLRRHCVGAGSAATFTPRPLPMGEGAIRLLITEEVPWPCTRAAFILVYGIATWQCGGSGNLGVAQRTVQRALRSTGPASLTLSWHARHAFDGAVVKRGLFPQNPVCSSYASQHWLLSSGTIFASGILYPMRVQTIVTCWFSMVMLPLR